MEKAEGLLNILRTIGGKSLRPTGDKVMLVPNTNVGRATSATLLQTKTESNPKHLELANPTVEEEEEILDELLVYNQESTTVNNID